MVDFLDGVSLEKLVSEQRDRHVRCIAAPQVHVLRDRRAACGKPADALIN